MRRLYLGGVFLTLLCAAGLVKAGEIQPESSFARVSSEPPRAFNPFSWSSWLSLPSQFMQYWFPFFQPAYRPANLQGPTTPKPWIANETEKEASNIFGMSGSPGDSVEYLPPTNEIEW